MFSKFYKKQIKVVIPSPNVRLSQIIPQLDNDEFLEDFSKNCLSRYEHLYEKKQFDFNEYICNKYTIDELTNVNIFLLIFISN